MPPARHLTIQQVDAAARARREAARRALPQELAERSAGKPWHFVLFGSLARGDFHARSDADIAVLEAGRDWRAAHDAAAALGVAADVSFWEDLSEAVRAEVRRDGIPCR
jgi:predicted nucleotidyltransferase